jgi:hypothetical protein
MIELSPSKITAVAAAVTVYVLRRTHHVSLFWALPLYALYYIAWQLNRMVIYERYITPLAKMPGPKVFC